MGIAPPPSGPRGRAGSRPRARHPGPAARWTAAAASLTRPARASAVARAAGARVGVGAARSRPAGRRRPRGRPDAAVAAQALHDLRDGRPAAHEVRGATGHERRAQGAARGARRPCRTAPAGSRAGHAQLHELCASEEATPGSAVLAPRRPPPWGWRRGRRARCAPRRSRRPRPARRAPARPGLAAAGRAEAVERDAAGPRGRPAHGWPPRSPPRSGRAARRARGTGR